MGSKHDRVYMSDGARRPPVVWGYTKTEFERAKFENDNLRPPHAFRDGRRLCPSKGHPGRHGTLFVPRPGFDPYVNPEQRDRACADCLMMLDMEKADEGTEETVE